MNPMMKRGIILVTMMAQCLEPATKPVVAKDLGNHHASTNDDLDPESIIDEETVRKSPRRSKLPSRLQDYELASTDNRWIDAMNKEMEALNKNNTWEISDLLKGRKHVGCKWIYKIKYKSNGEVETFKARLVAKGYSQEDGIDYEETFFTNGENGYCYIFFES
nr:putative ribonuclease H-like domain-containing protein [Tanacetum cinerariifolium]GEZ64077.1 putative ribonuclease H-like domain-containing protein [Tanacetum cinerariifolium]